MSQKGLASRREADKLIEMGLVKVNGEVVGLGTKVKPDDHIEILQQGKEIQRKRLTVALFKPVGYVSSQPEKDYESAMTLLQKSSRVLNSPTETLSIDFSGLAPAGRLDIDSKGLIIYTQDGVVAKKIIGDHSSIDKEYLVQFKGHLSPSKLNLLKHGLTLDGQKLRPAQILQENEYTIVMTLKQGRKRQIRRMLDKVGLTVTHLKRIRVGPINLGNLKEGQWRLLTSDETQKIINY